jgi:hypothetical protein
MPRHFITANENVVYTARINNNTVNFGIDIFGDQIIDCFTSSGNLKWSFSLSDSVYISDILSDPSGNILIGGKFMQTMRLGAVDSLENTGTSFDENVFLACLDSSGNLLWKKNVSPDFPLYTTLSTLAIDRMGFFWIALQDFQTSLLVKIDSTGQAIQTITVTGTRSLSSISFDQQNNMFFSGSAENGLFTIGNFTDTIPESYMMFVARINSAGNLSWVRFAHDVTFQNPIVAATLNGNAFLGGNLLDGTSWGTVNFNSNQWVYGIFLTRVDSLGNFQWGAQALTTPTIQGDFYVGVGRFLDADGLGNVFINGITRGVVDWGNNIVSGGGLPPSDHISILSFDYNGLAKWSINGGSSGFNTTHNISALAQNSLYFACSTQDTTTFGNLSVNAGNNNASIFGKINLNPTTGLPELKNNETFLLYPNPASEKINIHCPNKIPATLIMYDSLGKRIGKVIDTEKSNLQLNIESLPPGIYYLSADSDNRFSPSRFIKK